MIVLTEPFWSLAVAVSNVTCFSEPLPGECTADRTSGSLTDSLGVGKYSTGETFLLTSQSPLDRSKIDLLFNSFLSNNFLSSAFPANANRVKNMTLNMIKTWGLNPAFSVEGNHKKIIRHMGYSLLLISVNFWTTYTFIAEMRMKFRNWLWLLWCLSPGHSACNREIKLDVTWSYVKRQTAKLKLLPSVFSSLNSRVKIFVFVANSIRHFSIFMSV